MRFGKQLRNSIYKPWDGHYIDYAKLKGLLREDQGDQTWTEEDENNFCDQLLNVELEKVAAFQASAFKSLEERTGQVSEKLRDLAPEEGSVKGDITKGRFREIEGELDGIVNELNELKKYGSINYTGFLKLAKKHDRRRGKQYKIRPMVQLRLSKRPFNSEQAYTPLLNKLSVMYYVVRQQLDETAEPAAIGASDAQPQTRNGERYMSYKAWVHMDNLLEVRTFILRRLPVLVYSEQSSNSLEAQGNPTLSSLYFDNPEFSLYNEKVDRHINSSSVRIRWTGQLKSNPEVTLEQKVIHENGSSEERQFQIKQKYIQPFLKGEYKMEKTIQKMERQGRPAATIEEFKRTVESIQNFIIENELQPVLRANYTRTAFQKPQDSKVRIAVDTNLAFIREDTLDLNRPCRNPEDWHRLDIDSMEYPFPNIRQGEISRFPFAVLEIKVKEDGVKKQPQWIEELMSSHLVHRVPRFMRFVYGVASLFEDNVNRLPFWLSEVETDIHKDPQAAFEEEEERKARKAENELVVGSFLGTPKAGGSFKPAVSSPAGKSYKQERIAAEERAISRTDFAGEGSSSKPTDHVESSGARGGGYGTIASVFPSFSRSRYAQARRERNVPLPPGVIKPTQLIKDSGPLKVEPKVWLANERTYLKWQHICFLLGAFAIVLSNASGNDTIRMGMGITYLFVALFAAGWGYYIHRVRRVMIVDRSGKDFDNVIGPMVVSFALIIALIVNFSFRYRAAIQKINGPNGNASTLVTGADQSWNGNIELM